MRTVRRWSAVLQAAIVFAAALAFCACNPAARKAAETQSAAGTLSGGGARVAVDTLLIIHTNDHHGAIFPSGGLGGLSQRAEFIRTLKDQYRNVMILDAGDLNTGGVLSNVFKAEPDILGYNLIGYDAVALGNHEFDNPLDILRKQMAAAEFKFISANVRTLDGESLADRYIVRKMGEIVVAVIGITTSTASHGSTFGKNFAFENEITAAREAVRSVRVTSGPDFIILLTHSGIVRETPETVTSPVLADSVDGIDFIIDGHSHTRMDSPLVVNGVPIVSAFEWGKEVGQAEFIFVNHKIERFTWRSTTIDSTFAANREMDDLIRPFADSLQKMMGDTVAVASAEFAFNDADGNRLPRMGESAIGNLVCDAVMFFIGNSEYSADFVLINGGGVRAGLPQGVIIKEDIFKVLPFESFVEIIELTGAQAVELFNFAATFPQGAGGFAQVSKEARYELDLTAKTISNLTVNGNEIDPEKIYRVATTDFLSDGGDSYTIFSQGGGSVKTQRPLADIVVEYMQSFSDAVEPALDGRIAVKGR